MKKIIAFALTGLLALSGAAVAIGGAETAIAETVSSQAELSSTAQKLYLVPGTYVSDGEQVKNTVSATAGVTQLSEEECAEIFTENAYLCTLSAGTALPTPSSTRKDKEENPYSFNGWWAIVDKTVTYFKTVPQITETTYLYADWRADLSQRKDPIIPEDGEVAEPNHYMLVQRAGATEPERITLRKAYTDMMSAETLGYLYPVELVAEGFELNPGDKITVYTTGLTDDEDAVIAPLIKNGSSTIQLESSGDKTNITADYLEADEGSNRRKPSMTYIAEESGTYNIYIKFFSKGNTMAVYMEKKV